MDRFSREDLQELVTNRRTPCVSLLMQTTRGPSLEDKARWRSQLSTAEEILAGRQETSEANQWMSPAHELSNSVPFWQNLSHGLAAFIAPGKFDVYRLSIPLDDRVVVAEHFHIKPLLPLFSGEGPFYVLALERAGLRLLHATACTVQEIDLDKVPINVAEAFEFGDEPARRTPTATGTRPTRPRAVFDRAGIAMSSKREELLEYFHRVDSGLRELFGKENVPLVLAGPNDLMELYRQSNSYRHLQSNGVECQPNQRSDEQLRDAAYAVIECRAQTERCRVVAQYRQLAGTGRTAHEQVEVLSAAFEGRLQYLFVERRRDLWGTFDPATRNLQIHEGREPGDEDLLNWAALHVLAHRGEVYLLEPAELPDGPLSAIFWLPLGERSAKHVIPETAGTHAG